ncbi:MAG: type 4a pilus biogenesis protein PilO [Myxococcota bacterium]
MMELSPDIQAKLEQLAKLPRAVRLVATLAIALVVGGGYYAWFYQGASSELERLQGKEAELQRKLNEARSVAGNLEAFKTEIAQLEAKLTKALRQLPDKQELEVLLTDFSNLGKAAGVEIKSFKRIEERNHGFYAEVPIAIELSGKYHEIGRFFDLMAKLPRIVNMGALTIGVEHEGLHGTRLKVSGTATAFRFVDGGRGA